VFAQLFGFSRESEQAYNALPVVEYVNTAVLGGLVLAEMHLHSQLPDWP
jgi:hypothetical protein